MNVQLKCDLNNVLAPVMDALYYIVQPEIDRELVKSFLEEAMRSHAVLQKRLEEAE